MASTYSSNLKIELMATGSDSGTWGTNTNTNLGTAIEQAIIGYGNPDYTSDANLTITITNSSASQAARCLVLNVTSVFGSLTATRELIVPTIQKQYIVQNNTTGGQSITVKTSAGTGITVPTGRKAHLYVDGTNVIHMFDFVDINGGAIDGTTVGAASASTGAFTTLNASGATTLDGTVALGNASGDLITVPGTVNSNLIFTDNLFDIGATGATRPRNLFLAGAATVGGNLSVGGTLTLTGGVNLNGNVTVGDASTDTLTINSTITSNLIFTDNTYDIGASGATRPRNLFLAGNITAAGNQTLAGALTVDSTTDSTSTTTGSIQTDGGVGIAKALFVGTTANIAGATTLSSTLTLGGTVAGGGNQINNVVIGASAPMAGNFTTLSVIGTTSTPVTVTRTGSTGVFQQFADSSPNNVFIGNTNGVFQIQTPAGGFSTKLAVSDTGIAVTGAISATTNIQLGSAFNLTWGGAYGAGIPTIAVPSAGKLGFYPNGSTSGLIGEFSSTGLAVTGAISATGDATINSLTVGRGAGAVSTNTAVGASALAANTSGTTNTAVGQAALFTNQTGVQNTASGANALQTNSSGSTNVAIGQGAMFNNTTASDNTAIGTSALFFNTTGASNTAIGRAALLSNTTASNNTAVGYQAGYSNTTGTENTYSGFVTGFANTTGIYNSGFGKSALYSNTGSYNSAVGHSALASNTSGANNVSVGFQALTSNTTASNNTAVGYQSLYSNVTGATNTAVGNRAGYFATSSDNTLIGNDAGRVITTGSNNTALGSYVMNNSAGVTGTENVGVGRAVLSLLTSGSYNIAVGSGSLTNNTTASNNTAVGYQAGYSNTTGSNITAVGLQALYSNTTASNNTALGHQAGYSLTTGGQNTFIGEEAGQSTNASTTGARNNILGAFSRTSAAGGNDQIVIGYNMTGKGDNTGFINPNSGGVYQGNNSTLWSVISDQRLKKNIVDNNTGLSVINQIQVRNFEYRLPEEITEVPQDQAIKKQGVQLGVIAQEFQQILPECVKTESTGVVTVDTDNLTWYMVNAIKELKSQLDSVKAELATLKGN